MLEVAKRDLGPVTEDCIHAARVEAEGRQAVLQVGDIIATEHRQPEVEQPVTEAVARSDQRQPGLEVADPVSGKVALFLKACDRGDGRLAVGPERVRGDQVELDQARLQVAYSFAAVTFSEGERPIGRSTGMNGHPLIVGEEMVVICRI